MVPRAAAFPGTGTRQAPSNALKTGKTMTAASQRQAVQALDDPALADRVAKGEEMALRELLRRHNQRLFRTARAILRDDAEAEDAVQEAYLKAIRAIGTFRGEAKLSTWLTRIAANEALERLRKRKRAVVLPLEPDFETAQDEDSVPPETPEVSAMRAETRRIVERRIDALPEAFRTVFVLRMVEEMTVEETAEALGVPEATVRTRLFRARSLLRESLARELDVAIEGAFGFAGERCDRITEAVLRALRQDGGACSP
jgi:RNA polymerase sigma-70 factor (ECF subfamily)